MSQGSSERPHLYSSSSSSSSSSDEATSNRNVPNPNVPLDVQPLAMYRPGIDQYPDPSLIAAGIHPRSQESQGPPGFSSILESPNQNENQPTSSNLQDLETQRALSAFQEVENQSGNQESSAYLRRQLEEWKKFEILKQSQHEIQESSSNVRRRIDFQGIENDPLLYSDDSQIAAGNLNQTRLERQSSDEANLELAIQMSLEGNKASAVVIRESPAPEIDQTGATGVAIEEQSLESGFDPAIQETPAPGFQDSSYFTSHIDLLEKYKKPNLIRRAIQESSKTSFEEIEEMNYQRAVQNSIDDMLGTQGKKAGGISIRDSPVPETRTAGVPTQSSELQESSNQARNREVQDRLNLKPQLDLSEYEARLVKNSIPIFLPPGKKPKLIVPTPIDSQTLEERNYQRAIQNSIDDISGRQGRSAGGVVFRPPPAPEIRTAGVPRQSSQQSDVVCGLQESSNVRREIDSLERFQNQNQPITSNRPEFQESQNVRREIDLLERFQNQNQNQPVSSNRPEFQVQDFIDRKLAERGIDLGRVQESLDSLENQQMGSERVIQESPALEFTERREIGPSESSKGKGKAEESEDKKEAAEKTEEENRFLLCPSKSEEEDDYETLKFLLAFKRDGGSLLPSSRISLSNFIKKELPECHTITEPRCQEKLRKLYHKFLELCAKFHGVERQQGREYEMFEIGSSIWAGSSSSEIVDPHGPDPNPGVEAVMEDPEENVGQGNGADPNLDVEEGGDNAGLEDPGQNVGERVGADPTGA